ncbi:SH2B adapter protein 2-like isoform X1 [Bacillus rossius redtenbacheri]|uniref:SH2B adapter protein 2-like isoform X1 n=1 Tax=Bacillus rossius redtenbacheri TaxID=93214 RepID=UPI002FDEF930
MASVNASNDDSLSWVEFCEKYAKIAASDFAKAFCAYLRGNISEDARTTVARSDFVRKFVDIFVEHFEAEYSKKHPYNRENEKITNGIQESVNLNRNVLGNSNDEFSDYSEHEGDSPSPKIQQKTFFRRLSFKGLTKGKGLFHKQHSDEVELSSHRTNKHSKYNKHSKTKLAKIVVECRKEGIVNYLIGENMDGTQKWEKCRLALVKTVGGYMLEFYSPLKIMAPRKKLTHEEKLEKKHQAERLRYQKIKNNLEKYKLQQHKEKEKNLKKEKAIIKTVDQMTPRLKIWKKKAREHRKRLAIENITNVPVSPSTTEDDVQIQQKSSYRRIIAAKIKSDQARRQRYLNKKK